MCSGRLDPQFVLAALRHGADGVLVGGCHPGDCHYQEGNYKTRRRMELLRGVLRDLGVEDERVRLEWISASEGEKVQRVCNEMTAQLRRLGPLRLTGPVAADRGTSPPGRRHDQAEDRFLLVRLVRGLRGGGRRPQRGPARPRRAGGRRLLAGGAGLQARRRRGAGRRRAGSRLPQRRDPHLRAAGDGGAAAPQGRRGGRLRQLRHLRRRPRPGEPVRARGHPRHRLPRGAQRRQQRGDGARAG